MAKKSSKPNEWSPQHQADAWGKVAVEYAKFFVDPYRDDVSNPILRKLKKLPKREKLTVMDVGCGNGPVLNWLLKHFGSVIATDFSQEMLDEAKRSCTDPSRVKFVRCRHEELPEHKLQADVAISMNSLVNSDPVNLDQGLKGIYQTLKVGGHFLGVVPSMDGLMYHTMLLTDLGQSKGMTREEAVLEAGNLVDLADSDLWSCTFRFRDIEQHFWLGEEVKYRLTKAGFSKIQLRQLRLSWHQCAGAPDLKHLPAPWDWCFYVRK